MKGSEVDTTPFSFEDCKRMADEILGYTKYRPEILIICGSGLSGLADDVEEAEIVPYDKCPGFPVNQIHGQASRLIFGKLGGKVVVVMQGRFHFYQGFTMHQVTLPIRIMKQMGVSKMVVTNAAGGLNQSFKVGNIMIIDDHVNFPGMAGFNPLRGDNDERWGPRFPPINNAYDMDRNTRLHDTAKEIGIGEHMTRGTYAFVCGPSYETPAECVMLQMTGSDAVGMSTVPETIVAHHCGIEVVGMSLITNIAILDKHNPTVANHEEVLEVASVRGRDMRNLVKTFLGRW